MIALNDQWEFVSVIVKSMVFFHLDTKLPEWLLNSKRSSFPWVENSEEVLKQLVAKYFVLSSEKIGQLKTKYSKKGHHFQDIILACEKCFALHQREQSNGFRVGDVVYGTVSFFRNAMISQENQYRDATVVGAEYDGITTKLVLLDKEGQSLSLTCSNSHSDSAYITAKSRRWTKSGLQLLNYCVEKGFQSLENGATPAERVLMILEVLEIGQKDRGNLLATAILVQDVDSFVNIIKQIVVTCNSLRSKYLNKVKKRILLLLQNPALHKGQVFLHSDNNDAVYVTVISSICTRFFEMAMATQTRWVSEQLLEIVLDLTEYWGVKLSKKGGWPEEKEEKTDQMDVDSPFLAPDAGRSSETAKAHRG
eukprot:TRINITY_DN2370_c0_g2_i2.p1 TRINITY_DN2370_c0_g2~~TRINITY_DN2370_c0_g2_i2.p1  ORF type:complete len:365 (-),score=67.37 TRINITY_DN2370_c0_g2_i2:2-1096(-)